MSESSRSKAQSWPYPRHRDFEFHLRQAATRWFAEKGYQVHPRYSYILDSLENWPRNILLPEVAETIAAERARREALREGFPLHKYAHHGLSSQAMIFNLVGPLIVRNDLEPLQKALEQQGLIWPAGSACACFEYENRTVFHEDSGQPTSIDLVIKDETNCPRIFIESKLVEQEFGGCSVFADGDCDGRNPAKDPSLCYLHFIGRRYWAILEQYGFLAGPLGTEKVCLLTSHYQFFRELLFALELGGSFVLLYDERNPAFFVNGPNGMRGLVPLLLEFVPAQIRSCIGFITVQQIVEEIHNSGRHPWIDEFKKKYGLG